MAEAPALHVPSICIDKSLPGQGQGGVNRCTDDSLCLAEPGVVFNSTQMLVSSPVLLAETQDIQASPRGEHHPMALEGHFLIAAWPISYHSRGLSEGVIKMLSKSWKSSTVCKWFSLETLE